MNHRTQRAARANKSNGTNTSTARSVLVLIAILPLSFWAFFRTFRSEIPQSALYRDDPSSLPFFWSNADFPSPTDASSTRPVYPYSVIPHGAENRQELQAAIHQDPVVSAHYSDFRVRAAHPIRLTREQAFFVSYRVGNRVYWTTKKITLSAGEILLTDGEHLARTRCGNRLSEVPSTPTAPSEPTDRSFDTPVVPLQPELTSEPISGSPVWRESPAPVLLSLSSSPRPRPSPSGFIPPTIPIFCCDTSSGPSPAPNSPVQPAPPAAPSPAPSPTSPMPSPIPLQPPYSPSEPLPPSGPVSPTPPVATPEPGALILATAGLLLLLIVRRLRRI